MIDTPKNNTIDLDSFSKKIEDEYMRLMQESENNYDRISRGEVITKEETDKQAASWKQLNIMKKSYENMIKFQKKKNGTDVVVGEGKADVGKLRMMKGTISEIAVKTS